jgi:ferredoxin-nitrate reductase
LNAIIREGWIDQRFIQEHTVGFEELKKVIAEYPPERGAAISCVPAEQIEAAARLIGEAKSLVCTCLQGVYQSNQATAAAVQVNNINLVRGMIGRPGSGILQMNGQPTAQNTRETGADGDLPRISQLGERRAHSGAGPNLECRFLDHPALDATYPRDANLSLL